MSFSELIVVLIVILLVVRQEDIPVILSKFNQIKNYFDNIKKEIFDSLNESTEIESHDTELLNFYLQKIILIESHYDGEYSLKQLRDKYNKLMEKKIHDAMQ